MQYFLMSVFRIQISSVHEQGLWLMIPSWFPGRSAPTSTQIHGLHWSNQETTDVQLVQRIHARSLPCYMQEAGVANTYTGSCCISVVRFKNNPQKERYCTHSHTTPAMVLVRDHNPPLTLPNVRTCFRDWLMSPALLAVLVTPLMSQAC